MYRTSYAETWSCEEEPSEQGCFGLGGLLKGVQGRFKGSYPFQKGNVKGHAVKYRDNSLPWWSSKGVQDHK